MADDWEAKYNALKEEFEEFQTSSQEFESELESELERTTELKDQLQKKLERVQGQLDKLRQESANSSQTTSTELLILQDKLKSYEQESQSLRQGQRTMEQKKDDLERSLRIAEAKVSSLQERLDTVEEDYIVLKEEHDEVRTENLEERAHFQQELRDTQRDATKWKRLAEKLQKRLAEVLKNHTDANSSSSSSGTDESAATQPTASDSAAPVPPGANGHGRVRVDIPSPQSNPAPPPNKPSLTDKELLAMRSHSATMNIPSPLNGLAGLQVPGILTLGARGLRVPRASSRKVVTTKLAAGAADKLTTRQHRLPTESGMNGRVQKRMPLTVNPAASTRRAGLISPKAHSATSGAAAPSSSAARAHMFTLSVPTMFKKHFRNRVTRRQVWCSKSLNYIMWGARSKQWEVQGCLRADTIVAVKQGTKAKDKLKLFLYHKGRNDELDTMVLEAYQAVKLRKWISALQFVIAFHANRAKEWKSVCQSPQMLQQLMDAFRIQTTILQKGAQFVRFESLMQTEAGQVCHVRLNETGDRLECTDNADSKEDDGNNSDSSDDAPAVLAEPLTRSILVDDMCDINDFVHGHSLRFAVLTPRRTLVLEPPGDADLDAKMSAMGKPRTEEEVLLWDDDAKDQYKALAEQQQAVRAKGMEVKGQWANALRFLLEHRARLTELISKHAARGQKFSAGQPNTPPSPLSAS